MNLIRNYINMLLLTEDPMGFVHDLAASSKEHGESSWGKLSKGAAQDIKRAFNKNADHQWLSTLDTVHWTDDFGLKELLASGKDELSTTMSLPGEKLDPATFIMEVGLWVKGRITLAANDQDALYTGRWGDYMGASPRSKEGKAQKHRQKSSGVNKLPTVSKDYSRYGQLKPGNEYMEKMARNIPYVLDQSTWDPSGHGPNEALVDNWKPVGIVVVDDRSGSRIEAVQYHAQNPSKAVGAISQIFQAASKFGVPIYDVDRNVLWSPGKKEIKEAKVREYIKNLLTEINGADQPDFDGFMAGYDSISKPNPLNPRINYWYMGKKGDSNCLVLTDLSEWDGAIHIGSIQTVPPNVCEGEGYASQVMNKLVDLADKYGVPMSLDPNPFGSEKLGVKDLKSWYRRAGFKPNDDRGGEWWRNPR